MNYKHPIKHGTTGGYRAHFRHGEPMCEPCRDANRRHLGFSPQRQAQCGTRSGYNRHIRRGEETCVACRRACAEAGRLARQRRRAVGLPPGDHRHGEAGYTNYGCRCGICTQANATRLVMRRARLRSAA